jgi:hypothetical protein
VGGGQGAGRGATSNRGRRARKTRLARQLGERVAEPGWQSWWVPAGQEADAVRAAREGDVPVLLIADSAETRTALPFMLAAAVWAGELPGWLGLPGRVRLRAGAAAGWPAATRSARAASPRPGAGYRLGSDRGSPNHGSTLASKRVMAQIRSPARVST